MGQLHTSYTHDSNDELTNTMIRRRRIRTINVEKVFRCVDRGLYINNNEKPNAYRDSALQSDNIHLSAPCIYATVLECLEIMPGNKFLNIGSGIGYFSTMAGLLLGKLYYIDMKIIIFLFVLVWTHYIFFQVLMVLIMVLKFISH